MILSISQQEIEKRCRNIEQKISAFEADAEDVMVLKSARNDLDWLRKQYSNSLETMQPFVGNLKEYKLRLSQCVSRARGQLTVEYLQATRAVADWTARRDTCRDVLGELALAENLTKFESQDGSLNVNMVRAITIPKAGSGLRVQLRDVVRQSEKWEAVSSITGPKLLKALDNGVFDTDTAERLQAICPVHKAVRLRVNSEK